MRYLIMLILVISSFYSISAKAAYARFCSETSVELVHSCTRSLSFAKPYYVGPGAYGGYAAYPIDMSDLSQFVGRDIYRLKYSDEQCAAAYSGDRNVTVPSGSSASPNFSVSTGACRLYPAPGVMFCYNNDDGTETCSSKWVAESTDSINPYEANPDLATVQETSFQLTDDSSTCSNGSYSSGDKTYCYTGVSTNEISSFNVGDNGEITPNDSNGDGSDGGDTSGGSGDTGGDSGSGGTDGGSDTGGSSGGGSTGGGSSGGGSTGGDSGSDGSTGDDSGSDSGGSTGGDSGSGGSTGGDSGTDDGTDDGEGLDGVIDAIGSVRKAINDGFNNLLDTFTNEDGAPTGDQVAADFDGQGLSDDLMAEVESQNEDIQGELTQRYQDLFESDSSILGSALNRVRDTATSWLPTISSSGGCTPLTFTFQGHTLSIECRVFDLIKAALSWILFFFTAYQITLIALSYRNSSEG